MVVILKAPIWRTLDAMLATADLQPRSTAHRGYTRRPKDFL